MYILIIFFLIFLLDFIVTINIIQLLAAILIRINYLSIYLEIKKLIGIANFFICVFYLALKKNFFISKL